MKITLLHIYITESPNFLTLQECCDGSTYEKSKFMFTIFYRQFYFTNSVNLIRNYTVCVILIE